MSIWRNQHSGQRYTPYGVATGGSGQENTFSGSQQHQNQQHSSRHRPALGSTTQTVQATTTGNIHPPTPPQVATAQTPVMVPIGRLQPGKSYVRVSGRIINSSDMKSINRAKGGQTWVKTLVIKDETDSIEVKIWINSQEVLSIYSGLLIDKVVHVWTNSVAKYSPTPGSGSSSSSSQQQQQFHNPSTTCRYYLSVSHGKQGHTIVLDYSSEAETLYRNALGANVTQNLTSVMTVQQMLNTISCDGGSNNGNSTSSQKQPDNHNKSRMVVCVKQIQESTVVNTTHGPTPRREIPVFDSQGQEATMTLWGEQMTAAADDWIGRSTVLVLTGVQVKMFNRKPQISVKFSSLIEVDPICKNVEWLKHQAKGRGDGFIPETKVGSQDQGIQLEQIRTGYTLTEISERAKYQSPLETLYGFFFAIVSRLEIDTLERSPILMVQCPSCQHRFLTVGNPAGPSVPATTADRSGPTHHHNNINNGSNSSSSSSSSNSSCICDRCRRPVDPLFDHLEKTVMQYSLAKYWALMDDTAELIHPMIDSDAVTMFFGGLTPQVFWGLDLRDRTLLKQSRLLERFKFFFKLSWSDWSNSQAVKIVGVGCADLEEIGMMAEI